MNAQYDRPVKIKTLRSHTAFAKFLAELRHDENGYLVIAGHMPRFVSPVKGRYIYSPTTKVYVLGDAPESRLVVYAEVKHRTYEIWDVSSMAHHVTTWEQAEAFQLKYGRVG